MSETVSLIVALLAGILLGVIFFGGLHWTVFKATSSESPAMLFIGSLILRTSLVLLGFYFISGFAPYGRSQSLIVSLVGFVIARQVVIKVSRDTTAHGRLKHEASHAP